MWIEIFKGGKQIDSTGKEHDGDQLIDSAVKTFDEETHRPPLVLGHPRDDSPAYGWVHAVKSERVDGVKRLFADIDPVDALKDWVNAKLYQHRSAAFYGNGRLRHVGFLGGTPPAVKGLSPLPAFADDSAVIEFSDAFQMGLIARVLRRLREYFIEKDGADAADRIVGDWEIEDIGRQPDIPEPAETRLYTEPSTKGDTMKFSQFLDAINLFKKFGGKDEDIDMIAPPAVDGPPSGGTFTEADIEAAKKEGADQARQEEAAKFAEAEAERKKTQRGEQVKKFCEDGVKGGKLAPAWIDMGLAQFMERIAEGNADAVAFSEGGEEKTPDAWFREFLEALPKLVDFSEVATRDKDTGGKEPGDQLEALVKKKMEANPDLNYGAAFSEVQSENPELAKEYQASFSG